MPSTTDIFGQQIKGEMMKKLPLMLLIMSLVFLNVSAQTKKTTKTPVTKTPVTKTSVTKTPVQQPIKTVVAETAPVKTPTPVTSAATVALSKAEAEVLAELNLFRTNPKAYAKYLEDFLKTFDGQYFRTADGVMLSSFEGKKPVEEAIAALKEANSLPEFKAVDGLVKAASAHAQDLVKNNKSGHKGTDGSFPADRVARFGLPTSGVFENISYSTKNARDVVFNMLIDDGTATRNHRKNLLNPQLKSVGLATGENKEVGAFCVLVLSSSAGLRQL